MSGSLRLNSLKLNFFSTITLTLIIVLVISSSSIISNFSLHSKVFDSGNRHHDRLKIHKPTEVLKVKSTEDDDHYGYFADSDVGKNGNRKRSVIRDKNRLNPADLRLLNSSDLARRFDARVKEFFGRNQCKVQIFMTWISPVDTFGEREFFGLESLFQTNPTSCLVIVSRTMDSRDGYRILEPLITRGFRVQAITPDLWHLLKNTPAKSWLKGIKNGDKNPGAIPLAQNLSNLIRLGVIYKYGGIYLDTDFIVLKDLSSLRNSIGAQSADILGHWSRLNNALLVFDKKHPLIYKFIDEFAKTFNGNKWGHNGPYLVSRVVNKVAGHWYFNFTVLPPSAFYPVDWIRIPKFFARPNEDSANWIVAMTHQLQEYSYGVHLWNKQSKKLKIEEGSIIWRLISEHCVICNRNL